MSIELRDVSYVYEPDTAMAVPALSHIDLTIPDNQFVGLIGHTGSGKSTLVQLFNGLLKPTEGTVLFDGEDIHAPAYSRRALRAQVGLVFQYPEYQLFEVDVLKDVSFGPRNLGLAEEEVMRRAKEALGLVGMGEESYTLSPFDLSGGQKRRVATAGVLAMQPRYLVLDEPTAGLDPRGRDEILSLLQDMQKRLGITVVLVSHSMEDIARVADRLLVMRRGELLFDDVPQAVFSHVQELEETGLMAPRISYILKKLADGGLPVKTTALSAEDAVEDILTALEQHA